VFESRVLRRIFGPKRGNETGGWRKLTSRACSMMGGKRRHFKVLVGRPTGNISLINCRK
jgi:hypothetical protein